MRKYKLNPCPFCGKEPVFQEDIRYPRPKCEPRKAYEVVCKNRDCVIYDADTHYSLSKKKAIEKWNKRVDPTVNRIVQTLKEKAFDLNADHPESNFRFLVVEVKDIVKVLDELTKQFGVEVE